MDRIIERLRKEWETALVETASFSEAYTLLSLGKLIGTLSFKIYALRQKGTPAKELIMGKPGWFIGGMLTGVGTSILIAKLINLFKGKP